MNAKPIRNIAPLTPLITRYFTAPSMLEGFDTLHAAIT